MFLIKNTYYYNDLPNSMEVKTSNEPIHLHRVFYILRGAIINTALFEVLKAITPN